MGFGCRACGSWVGVGGGGGGGGLIGPPLIQKLRELQHGGETIREDTPERHRMKKGTPTMGGIVIIAAILSTTLLWANLGNRYVWVAMLATLGFGLLGVWDDLTKLRTRKGLSMRLKFGMQVVLTGDRKSTRLNSSHVRISYAVFCLTPIPSHHIP